MWIALVLGSGELVWWPYVVAKYGLTFVWMLVPACLLKYPLTFEIGRYTLVTGESVFRGSARRSHLSGVILWIATAAFLLWLGAVAVASGTALAALVQAPGGFTVRGRSLVWTYVVVLTLSFALAAARGGRRPLRMASSAVVAVIALAVAWACTRPEVVAVLPTFLAGLAGRTAPSDLAWDVHDSGALLAALGTVGFSGFGALFYSLWLCTGRRDGSEGVPLGEPASSIGSASSMAAAEHGNPDSDEAEVWRRRRRWLTADVTTAVAGNATLMSAICLVAYATLHQHHLLPSDYALALARGAGAEVSFGPTGRTLLLLLATTLFGLAWLLMVDGLARTYADTERNGDTRAPRRYLLALTICTTITLAAATFTPPDTFITLATTLTMLATVALPPILWMLNYRRLPPRARPRPLETTLLALCFAISTLLAIAYCYVTFT